VDVYGSDTAPDDEGAARTSGAETTQGVGAWFQCGSSHESVRTDGGIAVPVTAMPVRVREADALTFDSEEDE